MALDDDVRKHYLMLAKTILAVAGAANARGATSQERLDWALLSLRLYAQVSGPGSPKLDFDEAIKWSEDALERFKESAQ